MKRTELFHSTSGFGVETPPGIDQSVTARQALDYDEEVMLSTYLEELPPLTRKQRDWLGSWLCGRFTHYGEVRTQANLAAFRGVSRQRVDQAEKRILRKLRIKFGCDKPLQEELREIFHR